MHRHMLRTQLADIKHDILPSEQVSINAERHHLSTDIGKWRNSQSVYMPCLLNAETGDNEDSVEDIEEQTLGLPSDFTRDTITHHCLKELASVELEL